MGRADLTIVPELEAELDRLYGLPLGEFTAARHELAKRLKKAGLQPEAGRIATLGKPSVSAWAVNQLARRDSERVAELLEAGAELVAAQTEALAGKGAERFDDPSRRQREAVRALARSATAILTDAGNRPSDAIRERIASSLRAASVDPEGRHLLQAGRLEEDFESSGLGLLAGIAPVGGRRTPRPKATDERQEKRFREAREKVETARATQRRLIEEAAEAEREAERVAERARTVKAEAARATKAVEQAEKALHRLGGK